MKKYYELIDPRSKWIYLHHALIPLPKQDGIPFQAVLTPIQCHGRAADGMIFCTPKVRFIKGRSNRVPVIKIAIKGNLKEDSFYDAHLDISFELLPEKDFPYGERDISFSFNKWVSELWSENWNPFASKFHISGEVHVKPMDHDWIELDRGRNGRPVVYKCKELPEPNPEVRVIGSDKKYLTMLLLCKYWEDKSLRPIVQYTQFAELGLVKQKVDGEHESSARGSMGEWIKRAKCLFHQARIKPAGPAEPLDRVLVPQSSTSWKFFGLDTPETIQAAKKRLKMNFERSEEYTQAYNIWLKKNKI